MAHKLYDLTERLSIENGSLVRTLTTTYKNETYEIVKQENENTWARNIIFYFGCVHSYFFIAPTDDWYGKPYGVDCWDKWRGQLGLTGKTKQTFLDIENIFNQLDKEFIYTLKAYQHYVEKPRCYEIFNLYQRWKQHKECEMLAKLGYIYLAQQKMIYKLSKENKKKYIKCLLENDLRSQKYQPGFLDVKEKVLGIEDTWLFRDCNRNYEKYKYLYKQKCKWDTIGYRTNWVSIYNDYIRLAKYLNKDLNDEYWLHPNNLREKHQEVLKECEEKRRLENELMEAKRKQEQAETNVLMKQVIKNQKMENIDGYSVYLANDLEDIEKQASELHQCLISCAYYKKIADKNCILIFVRKENTPIATCEIDYNKKIRQYNANQISGNWQPNSELQSVMNTYINNLDLKQITV